MGRKDEAEYDVFISYRRDGGSETAKHLRDVLTERGYRVFFDTDSLRSGNFNRKLFDVIENCTDFIMILSPGALDRCAQEGDWVRLELAYALEHGKNVIPVLSGAFEFPENLPEDINDIRWQNGVAVNIEFFDAMIDKLVSFMHSKPVNRQRKIVVAAVAACAVLLAAALCFFVFGNGGSSAGGSIGSSASSSETTQQVSSSATTSGSSASVAASNKQQQKTIEPYTLGDAVEVYGADSHRHEYDISVDGVHVLPEEMKYQMWEDYDDETTALIGVQCSLDNFGYSRGSEGKAQPYQIAQDNTVVVKDEDGYMLRVVTQMYHGTDGSYSCESTTSIPSGTKGKFCLIFFVDKDASEVTLSIDSHNGTVYETPISL